MKTWRHKPTSFTGVVLLCLAFALTACGEKKQVDLGYEVNTVYDLDLDQMLDRAAEALDYHRADFTVGMAKMNVARDATLSHLGINLIAGGQVYLVSLENSGQNLVLESVVHHNPHRFTHARAYELFARVASAGGVSGMMEEVGAKLPVEVWIRFASRPVGPVASRDYSLYHLSEDGLSEAKAGSIQDGIIMNILSYDTNSLASVVLVGWHGADSCEKP